MAAACKRLKKGNLDETKLKKQLQAVAHKITGGAKTDDLVNGEKKEPRAIENTIIITPEGPTGAVPAAVAEPAAPESAPAVAPAAEVPAPGVPTKKERKVHGKGKSRVKGKKRKKR